LRDFSASFTYMGEANCLYSC